MTRRGFDRLARAVRFVFVQRNQVGPVVEKRDDAFQVEEGALYPALRRLERKGLLASEWGVSDTGRDARFSRLTPEGRGSTP